MKNKRLISTLCITLATILGAFAVGYNQKQVKQVEAAVGDTSLTLVTFDASGIPSEYHDDCSNFRIHFWYDQESGTADTTHYFHETGYPDIYAVNVPFKNCYDVVGYQLIFYQANSGDKYSTDMAGTPYKLYGNSNAANFAYSFANQWDNGKWVATLERTDKPTITKPNSQTDVITSEADNELFHLGIYDVSNTNDEYTLDLKFGTSFEADNDYVYSMLCNKKYVTKCATKGTIKFNRVGKYKLYFLNYCKKEVIEGVESDGFIDIRYQNGYEPETSYIYYVSQDSSEDNNINIYTFAPRGNGQFGAWPGAAINSLADLEEINCVSGFKFQNNSHKVYKIPYSLGDINNPTDEHVVFNYPYEQKTANLLLVEHAAYWRGSVAESYNYEAGGALDLFYDFQTVLAGVGSYSYKERTLANSICAISQSEAARLYNLYMSFTAYDRVTFIDCSFVNTYNSEGSGTEYISAYNIFTELGKRGGVIPTNSRALFFSTLGDIGNNNIFAIVLVTVVSIASVGAFFAFKKKKQD